jgi:hypothetical protein
MTKLLETAFVGAFLLCTVQPAAAIPIVFPNRAAFDATVPDHVVENWDAFLDGTIFPNGTTIDGITYTSSAGDALVTSMFLTTTPPNGLGQSALGFFAGTNTMSFAFDVALDAFAIDVNTFSSAPGAYTATTNTGEVIPSVFAPFPASGTGQFIGFSSSSPFTSVTIAAPGNVSYTLDTLRFSPIPEPASMLLVGAGLGLVIRRYRSSR